MKKITIKDEDKDFHTFRGDQYKFYAKDGICDVVAISDDPETGHTTRTVVASFQNYKFVKETTEDEARRPAITRVAREDAEPAPIDRYTAAQLASRQRESDFAMLDPATPIQQITQQAMPMIPEGLGLKPASHIQQPPARIVTAPQTVSVAPSIIDSIKDKWDRDGVDNMEDEEYGTWMGKLDPDELAALLLEHEAEVRVSLSPQATTAASIVVMPTPQIKMDAAAEKPKKKRAPRPRSPEQPELTHVAPDEADLADAYDKLKEAEDRHRKRRKTMCTACHDTGTVPNPDNSDPSDLIVCRAC